MFVVCVANVKRKRAGRRRQKGEKEAVALRLFSSRGGRRKRKEKRERLLKVFCCQFGLSLS